MISFLLGNYLCCWAKLCRRKKSARGNPKLDRFESSFLTTCKKPTKNDYCNGYELKMFEGLELRDNAITSAVCDFREKKKHTHKMKRRSFLLIAAVS